MNSHGSETSKKRLLVIGNGMVGHRFIQNACERGLLSRFQITVLAEEPRLAYDRVNLSKFFDESGATALELATAAEYDALGVEVLLSAAATEIDRDKCRVRTQSGDVFDYDKLVIATGSRAFVPNIAGNDLPGCFVYRTLEDLESIRNAARTAKVGVVIGGGLLGLEAANALRTLGLETHVVEFAPRLMPLQVDETGGELLKARIEALGVSVHVSTSTREIVRGDNGRVALLRFADGTELPADLVVFSAGIRPRDELAKSSGLGMGDRGGILINEHCQTTDANVYAIGECAVFENTTYGLVAPGYRMAEVAVAALSNAEDTFQGWDTSTKLKLMGVDVGSIGDAFAKTAGARVTSLFDSATGTYKKLVLSPDCKRLIGAMLVGDASLYGELLSYVQNEIPLPERPEELLLPQLDQGSKRRLGIDALPDAATICSCHNLSKQTICGAIRDQKLTDLAAVKSCTKAGSGCGSCTTLVSDLLKHELKRAGVSVTNHLCEHFPYTRQELYHLVRLHQIRSFDALIAEHGTGAGCEVCKPAVASILASTYNEHILQDSHVGLQDTNDRFLANIQRDGTYSVIPRIAAGEVTPDQLLAIATVAKK